MSKKIGLFGGTFNPPHFGHLMLAMTLKEIAHLDEVWFCPVHSNPLRQNETLISCADRIKMVELAVAGIPDFQLLDEECSRPPPSYTIDTLRILTSLHTHSFRLLLGSDSVKTFYQWREPEAIVELAPPLIGRRNCHDRPQDVQGSNVVVQALQAGWTPTPVFEISSTTIRQRLRERSYCGHLIPAKALDYIMQYRLY